MPETADFITDEKNMKSAAKNGGQKTLKNQMHIGSREDSVRRVMPIKGAERKQLVT